MAPALEKISIRPGGAEPMLPAPWRIEQVHKETADTFTVALAPVADALPLTFAAGQFNMLSVFGVGEVPISISGNPLLPSPLVHTTRAVGVVTRAMAKLKKGERARRARTVRNRLAARSGGRTRCRDRCRRHWSRAVALGGLPSACAPERFR